MGLLPTYLSRREREGPAMRQHRGKVRDYGARLFGRGPPTDHDSSVRFFRAATVLGEMVLP